MKLTCTLIYFVSFQIIFFSFIFISANRIVRATKDASVIAYYLRVYNAINAYRAMHTIPALRWNRTLIATAEDFAATAVAQYNSNSFNTDHWTGCNFYMTTVKTRPSAVAIVSTWYDEFASYDFNNPGYSPYCNNFTQLIWKSSTSVGIGMYSDNNVTAIVAKFYPVGNLRGAGAFRQNVIPIYIKM